jgi:DNA-binding transcriptional regulator YdaS (Cro superfamily)
MNTIQNTFIERGVDRADLAKQLGVTVGAVWQWRQVPAARVLDVERITGISRHELRPDVFGKSEAA